MMYCLNDITKEIAIDDIIYETSEKLGAIAQEMRTIRFSNLDETSKEAKRKVLREEFQKTLDEQQRKVMDITKEEEG